MTPKPKPKPKYLEAAQGGQRERWLISYTDFVTILLILFIAIAAQGITASAQVSPPAATEKLKSAAAKPETKPEDSRQALAAADEKLR